VTADFDLSNEMVDERIDTGTAEAIMSGSADRDSLAPELQRLAQLLDVVRSPAAPEELAGERATVAAFLQVVGAERSNIKNLQRVRAKRRAAKAVAALAFVAFSGTAAAAAATNHLPEGIQNAVSDAGSHIGVHVPKAKKPTHPPTNDASSDATQSQGQGPDATGAPKAGLCTAHLARDTPGSDHAGGVAEQNLAAAALAAGQSIDEYCAGVAHSSSESTTSDASDASQSTDNSHASEPKPPQSGKPPTDSSASDHPNSGKKPADPGASRANPHS
jgi:hypothetical protein